MRLTKIVCTLGPASFSPEGIADLAKAGMNVCRLNLSHGTVDGHRDVVRRIKTINEQRERPLAIMLDTKGAEIRTGEVTEAIAVTVGQEVVFSFKEMSDPKRPVIRVNYEAFSKDMRGAKTIVVDNGELIFDPISIETDGSVIARSRDTGKIGSRRHINLPGADVSLPAMMPGDWEALQMGCEEDADFAALSFIRTADEVEEVRAFVQKHGGRIALITKIETAQAVENIESIIAASDGIMVARGDLGVEIPFEKVPNIQDRIVDLCQRAGKPVIVATHMLESMIKNPTPTRAEVTDVWHAAVTRTDSTMLSGETATGAHPALAVMTMAKILAETETNDRLEPSFGRATKEALTIAEAAKDAAGVVLIGDGAAYAEELSALRLMVPVFVSADVKTLRMQQLRYGLFGLRDGLKADDVADALKDVLPAKAPICIVSSAKNIFQQSL